MVPTCSYSKFRADGVQLFKFKISLARNVEADAQLFKISRAHVPRELPGARDRDDQRAQHRWAPRRHTRSRSTEGPYADTREAPALCPPTRSPPGAQHPPEAHDSGPPPTTADPHRRRRPIRSLHSPHSFLDKISHASLFIRPEVHRNNMG